jgi:hypothetical protein
MTTAYTTLLGLALPVTGELSGTWGDTVNNSITQLTDDAIAGVATQSVLSADWTLTTTGSGASNQARYAILIPTGSPGVSRNIIAPSKSKIYAVINQSDSDVILKGAATTGVLIPTGAAILCAWNGTDFAQVTTLKVTTGTTTQRPASPSVGMLRYNTTTNQFEGYSGSSPAWTSVGGATLSNDTSTTSNLYPTFASATSGTALNLYTGNANLLYKPSTGELQARVPVASNGIVVNSLTVASSYTIAAGYSGMSAGPVTVASGQSVTVSSGSRWVVQ